MRASSRRVIGVTAVLAGAGAVAFVALSTGRGAKPQPQGELVPVSRGDVSVTVGGIGHVTTLTGAARLAVPSSSSAAVAASPGSRSGATGSGAGASSPREAPVDAVFPAVAGHVTQLLVAPGQRVLAGQPVARLADDGTIAAATLQARADVSTARLELAQKRVHDPGRGLPPTAAEVAAAGQNISASRSKLSAVLAPPKSAEVETARADLAKAQAELAASLSTGPSAVEAAQVAVEAQQAKLATVTGSPDLVEVAAAKLDIAKATVEQQTLLSSAEPPTDAARLAAQLAVDAARAKLEALLHPSTPAVYAARQELARAQAELQNQRATTSAVEALAKTAAVRAASRRLRQVTAAPALDVVSRARADVRKSQADLAMLQQRGAPASSTDLALAQLKVDVAAQRLALEHQLGSRLLVRASSSGTVTSVLTTNGASADPTTPIVRVQDLDHLVITVDLSEYDVGRVRVGAPALITLEALGGARVGGQVSDVSLSGVENGGVVNFPVTIALHSHTGPRPGMSVSARIIVRRVHDVLRVPVAAINEGDQPSVTVREPSGAFVRRPIEVGLTGTTYAEITGGLKAGDRVLVRSRGE
jgi:multidrug efflux pump subunit AcrA (membrane-fusion protein)